MARKREVGGRERGQLIGPTVGRFSSCVSYHQVLRIAALFISQGHEIGAGVARQSRCEGQGNTGGLGERDSEEFSPKEFEC